MRSLCSGTTCKTTKDGAVISDLSTVVGESIDDLTLGFTIPYFSFQDSNMMDQMIVEAVAAWQKATAKSCSTVPYVYPTELGEGCKDAPLSRRDTPMPYVKPNSTELVERAPPICDRQIIGNCNIPTHFENCKYSTSLCSGPDLVSKFFIFFIFFLSITASLSGSQSQCNHPQRII